MCLNFECDAVLEGICVDVQSDAIRSQMTLSTDGKLLVVAVDGVMNPPYCLVEE